MAPRTRAPVCYATTAPRLREGRWGRTKKRGCLNSAYYRYGRISKPTWSARTACSPDAVRVFSSQAHCTTRFEKTTCLACLDGIADKIVLLKHLAETGEIYIVASSAKRKAKVKTVKKRQRRDRCARPRCRKFMWHA